MGANGWLIVILAFFSTFCYTALAGDSLNVTIGVFGAMGLDTNIMYMMSTVGTIFGVLLTICCGALIKRRKIKNCWGILVLIGGAATLCWAFVQSTVTYCIVYLICFATTVASSSFLASTLMANWFPRTRGVAIGLVTVAYPLSAAVTTTICTGFLKTSLGITGYYLMMAAILVLVGILVLALLQDSPEDKGCYPDNDRFADIEQLKSEHQAALEYARISAATDFGNADDCRALRHSSLNFCWMAGSSYRDKKTGILVNSFAVVGLVCLLLPFHALNYVGLPLLAVLLGGSNNLGIAIFTTIWGRYDFANVYRVYTPISNLALGLGISVVGIIGTNISYQFAYIILLVLSVISLITMIALKIQPIDEDVHM